MVSEELIKNSIKVLIEGMPNATTEQAKDYFSDGLSKIIKAAIVSATITVPLGIPVQVAFPAGTGATTTPAIASIV